MGAAQQNESDAAGRPVRSILVIGGGSAGWITANLLNAQRGRAAGQGIAITVIEAPDVPVIGVGEATVPSIRRTLEEIGISERDFMRGTDATFKSLIRFDGWQPGESFDHPFDRRERPQTDGAMRQFLSEYRSGSGFADQFSLLSNICKANLAPKAVGWPDYQSPFPYAYHLDAIRLGQVLREFGTARGIAHQRARVVQVNRDERGAIASLVLDDGGLAQADLYIDCTGFSALLASQLMPVERDYSHVLCCDSAVTAQIPFDLYRPERIRPYTTATAKSGGWIWDINLQSRRGLGYVYSSAHLSRDAAAQELAAQEGPHIASLDLRHIRFKTYKRDLAWHENCIAIGLADGFVEPLESTGLYMIQFAAHRLAELLGGTPAYSPHTANHFNAMMNTLYEEVIGYIALHYSTSRRRDSAFWRDATNPGRIPGHLADLFEEWRTRPPHDTDFLIGHRLFSLESHEYLLFGMGHLQQLASQAQSAPYSLQDAIAKCHARLPTHEDWLRQSLG